MGKTFHKAEAYFQTSDNPDGTFWIWAYDPRGEKISLGDCRDIMIGLDLEPTTTAQEADALSALLRKHVKTIHLQSRNYMTTANEIIEACKATDRAAIKRLIEAIPRDEWVVEPGLATVRLPPATVRVWHLSGGSGINTYTEVSVVVELEDLDLDGPVPPLYQGKFTDEELKIANYIPRDARPPAGKTV
jgi:hypothetical protein